jgi:uncharacterized protein (TIGR02217 family)
VSLTIDATFPLKVSRGAKGGPQWPTRVLSSPGGHEQRIRLASEPVWKWEIELNAWSDADLEDLLEFWNVVGGRAGSFRFRDWTDSWAGMNQTAGGLVHGTPVVIGAGTGSQTAFQLVKPYVSGAGSWSRRITRPVTSGLRVYLNGVNQASGWTLNASTGVVTFASAPGSGVAVAWSGQFDVPARFDSDALALGLEGIRFGTASAVVVSLRE